ncbi:MAG: hypothetical protein RL748_1494 [Pseudomonadota bacterium]
MTIRSIGRHAVIPAKAGIQYATEAAQHAMLANLQAWVADYYQRQDPWSYQAHRRIFDSFTGNKREQLATDAVSDE